MGDKKDNSLPSVCDKKSPAFGGYLKIFVLQQVYDKKLIILPKTKETTIRRMVIGWEGGMPVVVIWMPEVNGWKKYCLCLPDL